MPFLEIETTAGRKRKRVGGENAVARPKKTSKAAEPFVEDSEAHILSLELQIGEGRKYYNDIATLLGFARDEDNNAETVSLASIALCRVFCRLYASGSLSVNENAPQSEVVIAQWLAKRYEEYVDLLTSRFGADSEEAQGLAVTLGMRLVKEEVKSNGELWKKGLFGKMMKNLLKPEDPVGEAARDVFVEDFAAKYDDVRYHLLAITPSLVKDDAPDNEVLLDNLLELLLALPTPTAAENAYTEFWGPPPVAAKDTPRSAKAHRKMGSAAWIAFLRGPSITKEHRKVILTSLVHKVIPWFSQVERLMDFLTDSFDAGGATSLLALSGMYYLIVNRNLDYPDFYKKLYSLLDDEVLHSKHRSRFFRLLDTFMSSTHLPAALVASFVKRLSRLALHAPPAGIVAVIPWIYNIFKSHPQCSFLIQRIPRSADEGADWDANGFHDPFDMAEPDPMTSGAIDSSIWEIETLQSHYHPNVATLAKIVSAQFTKQSYSLEDFLDHSYASLIDTELGKDIKKEPVIEYQIPKTIFTDGDDGLNPLGKLLAAALSA